MVETGGDVKAIADTFADLPPPVVRWMADIETARRGPASGARKAF